MAAFNTTYITCFKAWAGCTSLPLPDVNVKNEKMLFKQLRHSDTSAVLTVGYLILLHMLQKRLMEACFVFCQRLDVALLADLTHLCNVVCCI